ncbi:MAG: DUF1565 domain-containing protein, partial [Candidatus Cloacimonetes bacterium]|nr:DUF1565 domain-containing protein [Candidatus Cloacimonadota bacterium]
AIITSVDGDTIIVHQGTYIENINFLDRNIFLTSLFIDSNDRTDIENTVIQGIDEDWCITFRNINNIPSFLQHATLNGFTVTGGGSGGITIYAASPTIKNCIITKNNGTGLDARGIGGYYPAYPFLSGCVIKYNKANQFAGVLSPVRNPGGVYMCVQRVDMFDPVNKNSVFNNFGYAAADIMCALNGPTNISYYNVPLDTFTVATADSSFICNSIWYEDLPIYFSTDNYLYDFINQDIYVSPSGSDTNDGLSPESPLKSLSLATKLIVSNAEVPNTIYLLPGIYSKSEGQYFPAMMKSYVSVRNYENDVVIFDGEESTSSMIKSFRNSQNFNISGIHFKNTIARYTQNSTGYTSYDPTIHLAGFDGFELTNCFFTNCVQGISNRSSGGADNHNMSAFFKDIRFENCSNSAIDILNSNGYIENIIIQNHRSEILPDGRLIWSSIIRIGNITDSYISRQKYEFSNLLINDVVIENGIYQGNGSPKLILINGPFDVVINNATITNNRSHVTDRYLVILDILGSTTHPEIDIFNSIVYNNDNSPWSLSLGPNTYLRFTNSLTDYNPSQFIGSIDYENCISGPDLQALINSGQGYYIFEDSLNNNFSLHPESLCIDAGTTDIEGFDFPLYDLAGNPRVMGSTVDMGAYEFMQATADFEATPMTGDAPLTVQFTDLSYG